MQPQNQPKISWIASDQVKCVIGLDRDGVINEDLGTYCWRKEDFVPIQGSVEAVAKLRRKGYQIVEKFMDDTSVDFLQVDAIFMPVKKVNYSVEEIRYDQSSLKDKLTLEIWTNGSISPEEAIGQSSTILTNLFNPLKTIHFKSEEESFLPEGTRINQILIEELQLSVRAYNCLKRAQIHSVADLLDYSQEDLLEIKNFGQKSAEEVIDALQKRLGINLPKEKNLKNK